MKKIYAVAHTHWDREWYFTINDAALLSIYNFEKIVNVLENDEKFPSFCLDGQTSIIEDSIELRPELRDKIAKLVKEKRIFLGPWHTQTDSFLADGESYIRNLYFGTKFAKELGNSMKVGYLPDTFGHNIQTPQLFAGFGLNDAIFWRGQDYKKVPDTHFKWTALDGSSVLACNLPLGYTTPLSLDKTKEEFDKEYKPIIDKILNHTEHESVLFTIGGDQVLVDEKIPSYLERMNEYLGDDVDVELTDYETFFKSLREEIHTLDNLQEVVAELRWPEVARVHRTISSSRYDIKKLSFTLEHKLVNVLEPLSILVYKLIDKNLISKTALTKMWKLLLDGHAHDSLGACNTDITNENVLNRFKRAENLVDGTINIFKKNISHNLKDQHGDNITLFNFDLKDIENDWNFVEIFSDSRNISFFDGDQELETEIVDIFRIERERNVVFTKEGYVEKPMPPYYKIKAMIKTTVPSFGYKSILLKENEDSEVLLGATSTIENENLKLSVEGNKVSLTNKATNKTITDFIQLENTANDGDSYDFSPVVGDVPLYDLQINKVSNIDNKVFKKLIIEGTYNVPKELLNRKERSAELIEHDIAIELLLHDNKVDINLKTTNLAKDHRFRIKVNHEIENPKFFADVPFGFIERKFRPVPSDWRDYMVEQPANYFQMINTTLVQNDVETIQVITKGIKEYEITEGNELLVTLYKADGWLGKPDLEFRPNRASGGETPAVEAQFLNRDLEFDLQIVFENKSLTYDEAFANKTKYLTRYDYYQMQKIDTKKDRLERFNIPLVNKEIEKEYSLAKYDGNLHLVASYISYLDDSIVLRFVNLLEGEKLQTLLDKLPGYKYVNFEETEIDNIDIISQHKAITIKTGGE